MGAFDRVKAIAIIRDTASRHGPTSVEFYEDDGFHELIVEMDGSLSLNAYVGWPTPIATTLEDLSEQVLRRLQDACEHVPEVERASTAAPSSLVDFAKGSMTGSGSS